MAASRSSPVSDSSTANSNMRYSLPKSKGSYCPPPLSVGTRSLGSSTVSSPVPENAPLSIWAVFVPRFTRIANGSVSNAPAPMITES